VGCHQAEKEEMACYCLIESEAVQSVKDVGMPLARAEDA
jgi:hypothetical protein